MTESESIPVTLVALKGDTVLGTVSLVASDRDDLPNFSPWVAGLTVKREFRRQGIATLLLKEIEQMATGLGYPIIFLDTEREEMEKLPEIYLARGWKFRSRWEPLKSSKIVMFKLLLNLD